VCFARNHRDLERAREIEPTCASLYVELLRDVPGLPRAALQFACGRSLTASFYRSGRMAAHVRELAARRPLAATVAFSSAMAPYAPGSAPLLLDMVDVDSEKWADYARLRRPAVLYAAEARRLRALERRYASVADRVFVATELERSVLERFAPDARVTSVENGIDFEYFDPAAVTAPPHSGPAVVFVGAMNYFPNADACRWFAAEVFPILRRSVPSLEFRIVGRDPGPAVRRLARLPGVSVTGAVPDVRPYLAGGWTAVAPLRIARGVQNKVLEALSMGKRVLASPQVCETFGPKLPLGVVRCDSPRDYLQALVSLPPVRPGWEPDIRSQARRRFCWTDNMGAISTGLEQVRGAAPVTP
jgi:sugar transferase (PEP-CTERM/EpsH1 system associated)